MRLRIAIGLALFFLGTSLRGEEKEGLIRMNFKVPFSLFTTTSPDDPKGNLVLAPGVVQLTEKDKPLSNTADYDVRDVLQGTTGIPFPDGSQAIFVPERGILKIRQTDENLQELDALLNGHVEYWPMLHVDLMMVSLELPESQADPKKLDYTELKQAAGASWKEISSLEFFTRSGHPMKTSTIPGSDSTAAADQKFPPDGLGASCEIENIVGPDGLSIDTNLSYNYRGSLRPGEAPVLINFTGEASLMVGFPVVLQLSKTSSTPTTSTGNSQAYSALVLRVNHDDPDRSPFKAREQPAPQPTP